MGQVAPAPRKEGGQGAAPEEREAPPGVPPCPAPHGLGRSVESQGELYSRGAGGSSPLLGSPLPGCAPRGLWVLRRESPWRGWGGTHLAAAHGRDPPGWVIATGVE